jgi:cell division protein ZapA
VADTSARVVPVEILGQRYPIRSSLDETYVVELASYVDEKMRAAAEVSPSGDSIRLAVVAALNIADEFFRCRDTEHTWQDTVSDRLVRLEQLVDAALGT